MTDDVYMLAQGPIHLGHQKRDANEGGVGQSGERLGTCFKRRMGRINQNKLTYMYFDNGLDHCLCVSAFQLAVFQLTAVHEKSSKTFKVYFLQWKNGNRKITQPNVSSFKRTSLYKTICTFTLQSVVIHVSSSHCNLSEQRKKKCFHQRKKTKKQKQNVCWEINRIALVLFLNTNMAEVTSCKYRYIGFEIVVD